MTGHLAAGRTVVHILQVCALIAMPAAAAAPHAAAALDQWERELALFGSLKALRIFRLYKLWKGFRMWKKAVNEAKFSHAKSALQKNLFMLSPVFQGPMRKCV